MTNETDKKTLLKTKTEIAINCRGIVLQHMAGLEQMLNIYISIHFCGNDENKNNDMFLLILGDERMSLNSKAQVFYSLATTYDKEWYKSYVSHREPKTPKNAPLTMNNDLVYVIEERNIFAHRVMDSDPNDRVPENIIRFKKMKNVLESIDYDQLKFLELHATIIALEIFIYDRVKELSASK